MTSAFRPAAAPVAALVAAILISAAPHAVAQLPVGELAVSSYKASGGNGLPGVGGVYFVDPATATVTPVTGLPCELTGTCAGSQTVDGADVVTYLPQTGQLVASGWGSIGKPCSLFLLNLNGAAVTNAARYDLATVSSYNGLANSAGAVLEDGRVLLCLDRFNLTTPGPLANATLAIFDPRLPPSDPATLTPIPALGAAGVPNGMAVDQARSVAYVAFKPSANATTSTVYKVPVPQGGTLDPIVTVSFSVNAMTLEPDGQLLIGGGVASVGKLARIDPASGTVTEFPQTFGFDWINALRVDGTTGDLFLTNRVGDLRRLSPRSPSGTVQLVSNGGPGGWGRPSGLDMHDKLRTYGPSTGVGDVVRWQLGPNPGGAPNVGNATFSLTCDAGTPGQPAFWTFGANELRQRIAIGEPIELLVNPAVLLSTQVSPSGNRVDLPIPTDPGLRGTQLYVQCFVPRGADIAASPGLAITLR